MGSFCCTFEADLWLKCFSVLDLVSFFAGLEIFLAGLEILLAGLEILLAGLEFLRGLLRLLLSWDLSRWTASWPKISSERDISSGLWEFAEATLIRKGDLGWDWDCELLWDWLVVGPWLAKRAGATPLGETIDCVAGCILPELVLIAGGGIILLSGLCTVDSVGDCGFDSKSFAAARAACLRFCGGSYFGCVGLDFESFSRAEPPWLDAFDSVLVTREILGLGVASDLESISLSGDVSLILALLPPSAVFWLLRLEFEAFELYPLESLASLSWLSESSCR